MSTIARNSNDVVAPVDPLRRALETAFQMLEDRGWEFVDKERAFNALAAVRLSTVPWSVHAIPLSSAIDPSSDAIDPSSVLTVYFIPHKLKVADLVKAISNAPSGSTNLVILRDAVSDVVAKQIMAAGAEIFTLMELQTNKSRHALVPSHTRVPAADVPAILKTTGIKVKSQLPFISKSDPQARYLGLVAGDVVKIVRQSPTAGDHVFFRVCGNC